jgi:integration host factor subunit beta
MTKSQLIERIAEKAPDVPRREVEAIVNAVFDCMVEALRQGQRIEIRGFGSFAVKTRRPREGRNPKTGQRVSVPERRTLSFTVGKELRDRLNPDQPAVAQPAAAVISVAATPPPPPPSTPSSSPPSSSSLPAAPAQPMAAAPPNRW